MRRSTQSRTKKALAILAIAGAASILGTVSASADDHTTADRGIAQAAATPFDDHTTFSPADDHTTFSPADDHTTFSPADDHTTFAPLDDHTT